MIVGNFVTKLLREVQSLPSLKHSEPLPIQYMPVRQHLSDITEVNLPKENGEHATSKPGKTTVTLRFKQYVERGNLNHPTKRQQYFQFPNNTSTSYKIRLPYSMRSDGNWEVGLIGISMPELYLSMSSLEAVNEVELGKEKDHYGIPITFFAKDTSILSITNVIIDFCWIAWIKKIHEGCKVRWHQRC